MGDQDSLIAMETTEENNQGRGRQRDSGDSHEETQDTVAKEVTFEAPDCQQYFMFASESTEINKD